MNRSEFRFFERLRVRWAEVDMQGIVFNGHYLMYFDTAVAGYWRALAAPYAATMEQLHGDLFVRKATLEYHASARYDELCDVGIRCQRVGNSSILFAAAVFRGDELLVSGELVYVFADPATQTSAPVPQPLRDLFSGFEAGQSMLGVRLGDWAALGLDARTLRSAVFIDELRSPAEMANDATDATAVHAVAYNRLGLALGTGRLLQHRPAIGKIQRLAVMQGMRGGGIGGAVLHTLLKAAQQRGDEEVLVHAQPSAAAFFARAGFIQQGAVFEVAGLPQVEMIRRPAGAP